MNETKKRKQHYVFQAYLDSWTTNSKVWCLRDKAKKFNTSTINIAQERDFYRIKPLNDDERKFYNILTSKNNCNVKKALNEHMNAYLLPTIWEEEINNIKNLIKEYYKNNIPAEIIKSFDEIEKSIDIAINNLEEDYHCELEGEGAGWLNSLKKQNIDFYYNSNLSETGNLNFDEEKFEFIYFICVQYFRTKAIKERWISSFGECLDHPQWYSLNIPKENIHLENIVPHIFWEIQNSLAHTLLKNNAHLTLLVNNTQIPFITSDQPVINIKADYTKATAQTTDLVLYYPISPNIAITLNDDSNENILQLSLDEVHQYNQAIANASYHEIYANCELILCQYT